MSAATPATPPQTEFLIVSVFTNISFLVALPQNDHQPPLNNGTVGVKYLTRACLEGNAGYEISKCPVPKSGNNVDGLVTVIWMLEIMTEDVLFYEIVSFCGVFTDIRG